METGMKVYHGPYQHIGGVAVLSMCEVQGSISSTKPNKTNKTPLRYRTFLAPQKVVRFWAGIFFF